MGKEMTDRLLQETSARKRMTDLEFQKALEEEEMNEPGYDPERAFMLHERAVKRREEKMGNSILHSQDVPTDTRKSIISELDYPLEDFHPEHTPEGLEMLREMEEEIEQALLRHDPGSEYSLVE